MTKFIRSLVLSTIFGVMLVSCSFTDAATDTPITPLQVAQSTPTIIDLIKIELTVQADTSIPFNRVGQEIKYTYMIKAVTNNSSGSAPIVVTGATVTCPPLTTVGNLNDRFDQDEIIFCNSTYLITQADLDKGSVTIITTASLAGINSNQVTTTLATVQTIVLKLTKTATPVNYDRVGQIITYNYVITNSSAATLIPAQFIITDTGIPTPINCGAPNTSLASNATVTCSAPYTVTQADINAASVASNAVASATGIVSSQPVSATITKTTASSLTVGSTIQHKVVVGEWLWQIARCYGADPVKVSEANPPTPAEISPSTTVTVPNIGSVGKIYGPPCIGTHTVQSGDTWASIAQKYNADVTVLQMANKNTMSVGTVLRIPLNSAGAVTTTITPTSPTSTANQCVDLTRTIKVTGINSGLTHFNVCGTIDAGRMKISTIKVSQLAAEIPATNLISQDITVSVITSTPINEPNSLIVADMNYDGNDDFRILVNVPAGANLPYIYYLYDPNTNKYIFNEAYGKITSPEFPGNNEIRSQWRESAIKWGIDTYTLANNIPRLIKRETWEAIPNTTQARHVITTFNADGTSQVTVDETIALPAQ